MNKADVLDLLLEYQDRPVEIGLSDEGAVLYSGIEGHWLFTDGENLIEVKKNFSDGTYGFSSVNQRQSPFSVMTVPFEVINYVRIYIKNEPDDIKHVLGDYAPIGTSKSIDEVIGEIEKDSIRKAMSPRGNLNVADVNTKGSYGKFSGTAISTEIGGIPKYMKDDLLNK